MDKILYTQHNKLHMFSSQYVAIFNISVSLVKSVWATSLGVEVFFFFLEPSIVYAIIEDINVYLKIN